MPAATASTTNTKATGDWARSQQASESDIANTRPSRRKANKDKKSPYWMNQLKSNIGSIVSSAWSWAMGSTESGDGHQVTIQSALVDYFSKTALTAITEVEYKSRIPLKVSSSAEDLADIEELLTLLEVRDRAGEATDAVKHTVMALKASRLSLPLPPSKRWVELSGELDDMTDVYPLG